MTQPVDVSIRIGTLLDLPVIQDLGRSTYQDTFASSNTAEDMDMYLSAAFSIEQLTAEINEPGAVFFVASCDGKDVGYAKLRVSDEVVDQLGPHAVELQRLYVAKEYAGKGIGKLLMNHCLDYASRHQFKWVWLGVWEKNFIAQGFYKKCGFEKFGEHPFMMGTDPQTDWLLKRSI